jgi:mono/diheme cytochrome c family protein
MPDSGGRLGKYLGARCSGCHGAGFAGGEIVGGDPAWPHARNLTFHETGLAKWSLDDFKKALRDGVRPDGAKIDKVMPIAYTSQLKHAEIEALYVLADRREEAARHALGVPAAKSQPR